MTDSERFFSRSFQSDDDFWKVRQFLIETYPITPPDLNWEIRRWEGARFHNEDAALDPGWAAQIHLWETEAGKLVGVVNPDGSGEAHLQVHPDCRHRIEDEMIAWAEAHLAVPTGDGQRRLHVCVMEYDALRRRLLEARGYQKTTWGGMSRRLRLGSQPLPEPALAEGYVLRALRPGDEDDCRRIADVLNAAFNRDFHTAKEFHTFATSAPSFRYDLHLVAETPDGRFAAHVGITYDETNRRGIFEPVCTHPAHRRKGLAQALMFEGLRRLKALGALYVYVGTSDAAAANALYEAVGFTEAYREFIWQKIF